MGFWRCSPTGRGGACLVTGGGGRRAALRDVSAHFVFQGRVKTGGGRLVLNPQVSRSLCKAFHEVGGRGSAGNVWLQGQVAPVGSIRQGVVQLVGCLHGAAAATVWAIMRDWKGVNGRDIKCSRCCFFFFSSFNTTPVPKVKCRICKLVIHSAISYHIRVKFYGFQGQHCPKFIPECLLRLMFYIPTQWNQIKKHKTQTGLCHSKDTLHMWQCCDNQWLFNLHTICKSVDVLALQLPLACLPLGPHHCLSILSYFMRFLFTLTGQSALHVAAPESRGPLEVYSHRVVFPGHCCSMLTPEGSVGFLSIVQRTPLDVNWCSINKGWWMDGWIEQPYCIWHLLLFSKSKTIHRIMN